MTCDLSLRLNHLVQNLARAGTLAVLLAAAPPVVWAADAAAPALQLSIAAPGISNEFSATPVLEWTGVPGASYAVQSAADPATKGGWTTEDVVRSDVGPVRWMPPESLKEARYYRLLTQPALAEAQPVWVNVSDTSSVLYLLGQFLPTNAQVVIDGVGFAPDLVNTGGVWATVRLNGLPPGGAVIRQIEVIDTVTSNVVATLSLQGPLYYGAAPTAEQLQGPAEEPPASPASLIAAWLSKKGYDYYKAQSDLASAGAQHNPYFKNNELAGEMVGRVYLSKKGYDYYQAQSDLASVGLHHNPAFQENQNAGQMPDRYLSKRGYDYWQARSELSSASRGKITKSRSNIQNNRWSFSGDDEDCDDADPAAVKIPKFVEITSAAQNAAEAADVGTIRAIGPRVNPATGEVICEEIDLAIPGASLDFAWTRTYRSRTGPTTSQGSGWDFSYNVSLSPQADGTIVLRPGNGRADTFYPTGAKTWTRDEYFCEIGDLNGDGMPDVLFADTSRWLFNPQGTPAGGKLWQIIDRNGNAVRLDYDSLGRLTSIVDDQDRTNSISYNSTGQIESVTDFSGRTVRYEYDGHGDLVAAVSPPVTGTSTGNDFPGGITNRYAYTSGSTDERLNHNLTSCVDGKGQTWLQVVYSTSTDPASPDFDTVISTQRGIDKKDIRRVALAPQPGNSFATIKAMLRDGVGNVTECYYDSRGCCVRQVDFTGRSNPDLPVTETDNRPKGKLRPDDPDTYETLWAWNPDALCTLETLPDGERIQFVYERDFNAGLGARKKGDCRGVRLLAAVGGGVDLDGDGLPDITELVWRYEYDSRFGCPARNYVYQHNETDLEFLSARPIRQRIHALHFGERAFPATGSFDGDQTPIIRGGALGGSAKQWLPANFRVDIPGLPAGKVARLGRPAINTALTSGRCFGAGQPHPQTCGFVTSAIDPRGNVSLASYDAAGNLLHAEAIERKSGAIVAADFNYDLRGRLTAVTNSPDANGYRRVDRITYSSGGPSAGYVQSIAIDESGVHRTTTFECDARGNLTRLVDPRGNDWLFTYNSLDDCLTRQTPNTSFGTLVRIGSQFIYDENGNVVQTSTELRDETGAFLRNVQRLTGYDLLDRCTSLADQVSASLFITNKFAYNANGQLIAVQSPLAVSGADLQAAATFEYDERGLLFRGITAPGSGGSLTNELSYDACGDPAGLIAADSSVSTSTARWQRDGIGHTILIKNAMGDAVRIALDRNGNLTRARSYGELNDVPGEVGNRLLAETGYTYDSLDRCVQRTDSFFDPATGLAIGKGTAVTSFSYAPNGDCISATDDNRHATRYTFDTAGRLASITDPKTNVLTLNLDADDNLVGLVSTEHSDLVQGTTQFWRSFVYDPLGRCVAAADNVGNTNAWAYDSLDRVVRRTDPKGNVSWSFYDDLGRRTLAIGDLDGDGAPDLAADVNKSWTYDDNSRCLSFTDDNTNTTKFAYDSVGRLVSQTNPDGTACSLIWSPRSNLLRVQDPNGNVMSNRYDLLDRCVARDITPGPTVAGTTTFERYGYDGLSRVVAATNDVSHLEFAYDSLGDCVRGVSGGLGAVVSTFDGVGNRLSLTYPSGRLLTYTYDSLDQVRTINTIAGGQLSTLETFDYEGPGRVGRISRLNGVNTRIAWDGAASSANVPDDFGWRQVSGVNHQPAGGGAIIDRRIAKFDRNQNRTIRAQIAPLFAGGALTTNLFDCDALDRLHQSLTMTGPDVRQLTYQLDGNGNRQSVFSNGLAQAYSMDTAIPPGDFQMNQYTTTPFGSQVFDDNGNLTGRGSAVGAYQYVYDCADRLVAVNDLGTGASVAAYAYDALGRRIAKTVFPGGLPPLTTAYVHGDADLDVVLEEYTDGALAASYVWPHMHQTGSHARIAPTGDVSFALSDDLGNVLALTGAGGVVIERYHYDDFGLPQFLTSDGGPIATNSSPAGNPFLFHGSQWDSETEFYFGHSQGSNVGIPACYSDPRTGRSIDASLAPDGSLGGSMHHPAGDNNPWSPSGRHTPFQNPYRPPLSSARTTRERLKTYFETGDIPTQDPRMAPIRIPGKIEIPL
jgi:YD repeat-containing protein